MNKREYEAVKRELMAARDREIREAEDKFEQGLKALDHIWDITSNGSSVPSSGGGTTATTTRKKTTSRKKTASRKKTGAGRTRRRARGTLIEQMRQAVKRQTGEFTIADVKKVLAEKDAEAVRNTNPAVFSTTIKRLEDLGEIQLVSRGRGRRASVYKQA